MQKQLHDKHHIGQNTNNKMLRLAAYFLMYMTLNDLPIEYFKEFMKAFKNGEKWALVDYFELSDTSSQNTLIE